MPSRLEREQIRDRIAQLKDERAQLQEAIRFHRRGYRRNPQDGFQGRDLETKLSELNTEISRLYAELRGDS